MACAACGSSAMSASREGSDASRCAAAYSRRILDARGSSRAPNLQENGQQQVQETREKT